MSDGTCSIDGCEKPASSAGWCGMHYSRWQRHGDPLVVTRNWYDPTKERPACSVDDCARPVRSRGWCDVHYQRWRKRGTLEIRPVIEHCTIEGCDKPNNAHGLCKMHDYRLKRTGTTDPPQRKWRSVTAAGYVIVKVDSPLAHETSGWTYEHRAVLMDSIGPGCHPCHWCGCLVDWDKKYPAHKDALVVDHLDGCKSNNDPANLVPACAQCNLHRPPLSDQSCGYEDAFRL